MISENKLNADLQQFKYVLCFQDINASKLMIAGGKGANLGELSRIKDIKVPDGFCVNTTAYKEIICDNKAFNSLLDQLAILKPGDRKIISETTAKIRKLIWEISIPKSIDTEITRCLKQMGERNAYAVRSSATAEDLSTDPLQDSRTPI